MSAVDTVKNFILEYVLSGWTVLFLDVAFIAYKFRKRIATGFKVIWKWAGTKRIAVRRKTYKR